MNRIRKETQEGQPNENMIKSVLTVFQEIDKVESTSKTHIFELLKLFKADPHNFQIAFELAYLKIFKLFHEKGNRKMPPKYEQLSNLFFQEIIQKNKQNAAAGLLCFFLEMLSEGVYSMISGIRITTARMLFHLIKMGGQMIRGETKKKILTSIFHLVRQKVSTYRQIGIKLASLVLNWEQDLRDKIEQQLFKILATQENEQIRKMTITNLLIKSNNIDRILIRLRDKCPEVRSIVIRKLIGEKYSLESMTLKQRYHLLYDGFGNKEILIQQETLKYFTKYFENQHKKQHFAEFLELFRPNLLLIYPHLYTLFDNIIGSIVEQMPIATISQFTNKITNELKQMSKNGHSAQGTAFKQLIWLKKIGQSQNGQLKSIFQECVPSGLELSKILLQVFKGRDIFTINECLQLFSLQKSADEIGRNKMFDSLKKIIIEMQYFQFQKNWESLQLDDICPPISQETLKQKKMMISYFDLPIISHSYDLIFEISRAMKALWPDHYEIELKQIMAEWNNPEENTILVEKELTLVNIRKVQASGDNRLIQNLKVKLLAIEEQLMRQDVKTRLIILSLNRLRSNMAIDDFMPIIKEDLAKKDQSQGLILLGLYCLEGLDRVQTFLPLYWMHLTTEHKNKLHLLVSLKVITDFTVKFDLSRLQYNKGTINQFNYTIFINKFLQLVIDRDPSIRILAIEGLCRIIYHGKVEDSLLSSCFMRLLLLWWQTSSEEISARSVHTISIFVKQYIERGGPQVRKLSECLCVFFGVLMKEQAQRKVINKKKITYNLKMEEFVKRSIVIAMTVLKYHKESRQVIWKYQETGAELGPQELFLLFLYRQTDLHQCIEKAVNICDFYEDAPLETLILIKKSTQVFLEESNFSNNKKLELVLKKMQEELKSRIQVKNQQTFNEQLLKGLQKELSEYFFLIENSAKRLSDELQNCEIFVVNKEIVENVERAEDEQGESMKDDEINQEQIDAVIAQIQNAVIVSDSVEEKVKKQRKNNLSRISEGNQIEYEQKDDKNNRRQSSRIKKLNPEVPVPEKNKKRTPGPINQMQDSQQKRKMNIIPIRTRSRHKA